ncbi:MAG: hypothetical protein K2F66_07205 [Duncaniella sp.]|nr:hypothetical protein [Duncaniella sp.]
MWGILRAQGFWVSHTKGVTLRNIKVNALVPDARPVILATDSEQLVIDN